MQLENGIIILCLYTVACQTVMYLVYNNYSSLFLDAFFV